MVAAGTGRADGRSCLYIVAFHHMIGDPMVPGRLTVALRTIEAGPGNRGTCY